MNAVFLFVASGCGACHEYMPRFERAARGRPVLVHIYDIAKDQRGAAFADRLGVRATPTTVVMHGGKLQSHVGALNQRAVEQLFAAVT